MLTRLPRGRIFFLLLALLVQAYPNAQQSIGHPLPDQEAVPEFIRLIRSERANVAEVQARFEEYYNAVIDPEKEAFKNNPANKGHRYKHPHEHAYKVWRSQSLSAVTPDGFVDYSPAARAQRDAIAEKMQGESNSRGGDWSPVGPMMVVESNSDKPISWQVNIFDIAMSDAFPDVLYAATESGGLFFSSDKGLTWKQTRTAHYTRNIRSVAYWPQNYDYVRIGVRGSIIYSDDAADSWLTAVVQPSGLPNDPISNNYLVHDILFSKGLEYRAFAATSDGLFVSDDYGKHWVEKPFITGGGVTSIVHHPTDPNTVYMLMQDRFTRNAHIWKSTDNGDTWERKNNGWFEIPVADQGKFNVWGGRIAVSPDDPERIYVVLNEAYSDTAAALKTYGFIGIFRSNDGGDNWTRLNAQIGAPYNNTTHPNLMSFGAFAGPGAPYSYAQVDYLNNAIAVSSFDADHVYLSGLSMWESTNGGTSWTLKGGYGNAVPDLHPDIRHIIFRKTSPTTEELFICSDGGINYSPDGTLASHEARNLGIFANELWGFDMDMRQVVMGGGSYHNGDNYYSSDLQDGTWKHTGGGEQAAGAVQYGTSPRVWFHDNYPKASGLANDESDDIKPYTSVLDQAAWSPNDHTIARHHSGSRIMFDARNPHWIYWGHNGKFCRSTDDGVSAQVLFDFGDEEKVQWFEQAPGNPNVLYLKTEFPGDPLDGFDNRWDLYRSTDGGFSWIPVFDTPQEANFIFTVRDDMTVYRADDNSPDDAKIKATENGGLNWYNISSIVLNSATINAIYSIPGFTHHLVVQTSFGGVFRWLNFGDSWENLGDGTNTAITAERFTYFAPERVLVMATRGQGVWATQITDQANQLHMTFASDYDRNFCVNEPIQFYNRTNSTFNAEVNWIFPFGTPSSSTEENPVVTYDEPGTYPIGFDIVDLGNLTGSGGKAGYITIVNETNLPYDDSFENDALPFDWVNIDANNDTKMWAITNQAGGYGNSAQSLLFDNYNTDSKGWKDELRTIKFDLTQAIQVDFSFDLAYALYAPSPGSKDSLEIAISTDCGKNFTPIWRNGGSGMATAPPINGFFIPDASQWTTIDLNLDAFIGHPDVMIAFRNIGHYANALYVDNFSISSLMVNTVENAIQSSLLVSPNPSEGEFRVRFDLPVDHDGENVLSLIDPTGREIYQTLLQGTNGTFDQTIRTPNVSSGIYLLRITGRQMDISHKVMIR